MSRNINRRTEKFVENIRKGGRKSVGKGWGGGCFPTSDKLFRAAE
jgi:hypothetical protein